MYDYPLYRPPSESKSLILQLTHGCSHNRCTFCNMYKSKKFYIKTPQEIDQHIQWAKENYGTATKIFLADGNALVLETAQLEEIITRLFMNFPQLESVSTYGSPRDLLKKTPQELLKLRKAGLSLIYLGVESGSDTILKNINKGVTAGEMILAGRKTVEAGIQLSCMVISGLGGKELWEEHAIETAKAINSIKPHYFAPLTLMVEDGTLLKKLIDNNEFKLLNPAEVIHELELMIENLDLNNCLFRSNHASNYVSLRGVLNEDKEEILMQIRNMKEFEDYKPEGLRGL